MAPPPLRPPHDRRALAHWSCWHDKWSSSLDISVQDANSMLDVRYGSAPVLKLRPRAPPYHSPTGSSPSSVTCGNRCADAGPSRHRRGACWRLLCRRPCRACLAAMEAVDRPMPRPDGIGFCACRVAIEAVILGLVSVMYAIECVCRSFEHYTVQISLAHQTPFPRQVLSITPVCR